MSTNVVRQDVIELVTKTNTDEIDKLKAELEKLKSSIKGNASEPLDKLGKNNAFSKLKQGFSSVSKAAKNFGTQIDSAADKIQSKIFNLKSLIAGVVGGKIVKSAIDVVVDRQDLTSQFEVLLGSADKAKKRVEELTDFASKTPFSRDEIFRASKQLQVFAGDAISTGDSLKVVGDVAAGTGQSFEDVALWTGRLYSAMNSKQKVGEMVSRLQEMGAISGDDRNKIEALAKSGGDMGTKWKEVEKILGRFDGTMEKMSNNMGNMLLSLKSFATNSIFLPLGEGIAEGLQPAIQKFREFRKTNKADVEAMGETLRKFGEKICVPLFNGIEVGVEGLIKIIGALKDGVDGLEKIKGQNAFMDGIINAIQFVIENKDTVIDALQGIALVCASIVAVSKIKQLATALKFFTTPLGLVSIAIFGLFMIFKKNGGTVQDIIKKIGKAIGWLKNNLKWLIPVVTGLAGALLTFKGFGFFKKLTGGLGGKSESDSNPIMTFFSGFAKLKTSTVLKAMGNIAIVVGGLTLIASIFVPIANELAQTTDLKAVLKVVVIIGTLGLVGSALAYFSGIVGKIPFMTVTKGLANIAIVLVGLGAVLWTATQVFSEGINFKQMLEIVAMIGILGTVGTLLAIFAGIVGMIPIPIVLAGLASIALAIVGVSAIILAYGALGSIPGYNDFISKGGDTLANIFKQIGKMGGSLVGGIGEGISNSLPKIGENLATFAEKIKPMFEMFQGVDMSGAGTFFSSLGDFMLKMGVNDLISVFTGGTDLGTLGTKLTTFANNASGFFTKVATIPANGFENAKLFFNSLAGVNDLPKEGGIAQWFTGTINYESLANGLGKLSSEKVIGFFSAIENIPQAAFEQAKLFFNALAGVKGLPEEGGLKQWFTGTINYESLANGLGKLSSEKVMGFFTAVANIPQVAFEQTKLMFAALADIKGLPKKGGLVQWFTGDSLTTLETLTSKLPPFGEAVAQFYTSISGISDFSKMSQLFEALSSINKNVGKKGGGLNWIKEKISGSEETALEALGSGLKQFGENTKDFFNQINGLNLNNLNGLWESIKNAKGISADTVKAVGEDIDDIVKKVTELPVKMGDGIKSAGNSLSESLVYIWQEAAKAMAKPVNKVIDGANWILKEFGADKTIASWTPYAKGTDGHKGGNALVNDGRGAELVQMPNGKTFIPQGKNVFIPNAPKGMKVLPAEQTANLLGQKRPTFRYAKGIGNIDLFSYFDNASGLVDEIKKTVNYDGLSDYALSAGKGMVNTVTSAMPAWVEKQFEEFGAKSLASYVSSAGVEQWESTVAQALKMTGQYNEANVKRTLYQMQTESGGNPKAINLWDSNAKKGIPSKGLMQVIDPTFKAYAMPGFNSNVYDPLSNILASIRYAVSRYGSLTKAYQGHGYANGGIANKPSIFGEDGKEMAIPLSKDKRKRGLNLWAQTGEMLGVNLPAYSPEDSGTTVNNNNETNNYSPVFNLTVNNSGDDRTMARKIKTWISEAIDETFDAMSRKTPVKQM